jgi:amino acid transporter
MQEQRVELQKSLRPLHVTSLALGCIIGWGCFVLAGDFLARAGPLGATIGLLAGAALMLLIVESYAPLVERFPVAGAEFAHAYYAAGRYHAYLCGWFLTLGYLSIIPLNATALALLGKFLAPELFARGLLYSVAGWNVYLGEVLLASTAILLVGYFNYRSVRSVGVFQLVLTSVLVATVLLIAIGTLLSPESAIDNFRPLFSSERTPVAGILAMVAVAPWLYVGFDTLPQAAEELSFSHKQTRRLMVVSILAGAAMYVTVLLCTAAVGPWQELVGEGSPWLTGATVRRTLGPIGLTILGLAVGAGIFTGINGFYLASSRLLFSMGRAKLLPESFGRIHPEHGTPHVAIAFACVVSLLAPWFGRQALLWVVDMSALGTAFGYAYTCFAAYVLLKSRGRRTALAVAGTVASLGFVVLLTVPGMPAFMSRPSWVALGGWVALGLLLFLLRAKDYRSFTKQELDHLILKE